MSGAPRILVCSLSRLAGIVERERPSALISLGSDGAVPPRPPSVRPGHHLALRFHDVVPETVPSPDLIHPSREHAAAIVAAARAWDRAGPLLIHCGLGVSRSPAAAIIALAALEPDRDPHAIARAVRERAPSATPNAALVAEADALLERGGTLSAAVAAIGRGRMAMEGEAFALELSR